MRVLLPIDADESRAVAAAETVTTLPNAADTVHVTILNAEKEVEAVSASVNRSKNWKDDFPASVEKAGAVLEDAGISVEKRREHADPSEAIVNVADEIDADRIIMAGRKRTPVGKVLFGSVTQSVLLDADIPVTVISE
ncbi:MAG: universal stress protein [Halovenus sp.]